MVTLFRDLWKEKRSKILSRALDTEEAIKSNYFLAAQIVDKVFYQLEIECSHGIPRKEISFLGEYRSDGLIGRSLTQLKMPWDYYQELLPTPLRDFSLMADTYEGEDSAFSAWEGHGDLTAPPARTTK